MHETTAQAVGAHSAYLDVRSGAAWFRSRQRERNTVKTLAFIIGLFIAAVGAGGIVAPSVLVWVGQPFTAPVAWHWYVLATVRAAFGVLLLSVAKASRAPRTLRVVACIPLAAALGAFVAAFVEVDRARATIEWWSLQGPWLVRLSAAPLLAPGGFVAYACAPPRRIAK